MELLASNRNHPFNPKLLPASRVHCLFFCLPLDLQTVRDKCFNKCIPKPGSSISSSESTCVNRCVERYIEATGIISKAVLKLADR